VYGLIQGLYPLLVAYAIAFNAAPAVRALKLSGANAAVEARNDARRAAANQLARPSAELRAQLAAARKMVRARVCFQYLLALKGGVNRERRSTCWEQENTFHILCSTLISKGAILHS